MGNVSWDLAGFTDEQSRLGKKVGGGMIVVPFAIDVDLSTDEIVWSSPWRYIVAQPRILDQFVQLWREKPKRILRFARSWGVLCSESERLHLATVLRPLGSDPKMSLQYFGETREVSKVPVLPPLTYFSGGIQRFEKPVYEYREPLAFWQFLSHRANAALNIAAALRQHTRGRKEDWECLEAACEHAVSRYFPHFTARTRNAYQGNVEYQSRAIALEANFWLELGRVGFEVHAGGSTGWRIAVDYRGNPLGAIAFQLALTMSAAESFFTCSGCGLPYLRRKKSPKLGESNFCESCHDTGVALRNADRARRARIQQARKLRAEGLTISEIAKKVGARNLSTVRRWIAKGK